MQIKYYSLWTILLLQVILLFNEIPSTAAQEPSFELPVELVGFPIIIIAVRLSNFVKKLAYSLNPRTYVRRSRREITSDEMINMMEAEKRLVTELGDNVCIYPKVCLYHAGKARARSGNKRDMVIDWNEIFSNYKQSSEKQKEYYFLSVFLGDFIGSPRFCNQLVKRGRACVD